MVDVESLSDDDQESLRQIASALSQFREVLRLRGVSFRPEDLALMLSAGLSGGSLLEDLFKVVAFCLFACSWHCRK